MGAFWILDCGFWIEKTGKLRLPARLQSKIQDPKSRIPPQPSSGEPFMPSRLMRVDRRKLDRAPVSRGGSRRLLTASLAAVAGVMGVSLLTGWPAVRSAR